MRAAHIELCRVIAIRPDLRCRGRTAIEHAITANKATDFKFAYYLDTLAAALADRGDFTETIRWQKKAIEIGFDDKEEMAEAQKRLKLYEQPKPYRDGQ